MALRQTIRALHELENLGLVAPEINDMDASGKTYGLTLSGQRIVQALSPSKSPPQPG